MRKEGYNMAEHLKSVRYQVGEFVEEGQYGRTFKVPKELIQVTLYSYNIYIYIIRYL